MAGNNFPDPGDGGGGGGGTGDFVSGQPIIEMGTGSTWRVGIGHSGQISIYGPRGRATGNGNFITQDGTMYNLRNYQIAGSRSLTDRERQAWGLSLGGGPGGGFSDGGGGGVSASTALQELRERIAFESAEGQRTRTFERNERLSSQKFSAEQERLSRENAYKMQMLQDIGGLTGDILSASQQARQMLAEMSTTDPLRAAPLMAGGLPRGVSPATQVRGELTEFANRPIPGPGLAALSPQSSIPQLQGVSNQLRNRLIPPQPRIGLGLAKGGVVDLEPGEAVMVGEGQHGEGLKKGTAEVMRMLPGGEIEVIPLQGGAATGGVYGGTSGGGIFGTPQYPTYGLPKADILSSMNAMAPAYGELGFQGQPPRANRAPGWIPSIRGSGYHPYSMTDTLRRLGVRPRLVQFGSGDNFFLADQSGLLRRHSARDLFSPFMQGGGYDPNSVVQFNPQNMNDIGGMVAPLGLRFDANSNIAGGIPPIIGAGENINAWSPMAAPLIEPTSGMMLPDPVTLAGDIDEMDASTLGIYGQALEIALGMPRNQGMGIEYARQRARMATPVGGFAGQAQLA